MIDIHSHVLPALDDGPPTLEEAIAMVRMAAANGTTDIVATPHANHEFTYDGEVVAGKIGELDEASGHVIRIHRGCDLHLSLSNILDALENPSKYTINGGRYLLVEFPDLAAPTSMDGALDRLLERGITPIITHPERHALMQRRIDPLKAWTRAGCLVQITALSLLGGFGKGAQRCSEELMGRNLVHFVASDGHDLRYRPPVLGEAYRMIAASYGDDAAGALFRLNPAAVLAGDPVT